MTGGCLRRPRLQRCVACGALPAPFGCEFKPAPQAELAWEHRAYAGGELMLALGLRATLPRGK